jgi:Fur family ferric uptake transcriptional regulator
VTRQRTAVARALERADGFQTAQALHDAMRRAGDSIGLTTVYRHLQALADAGEVDVLRTGEGEAAYRQCAVGDHHHHLVCRTCGTTVEVTGPAVEAWAAQVARRHGFRDVSHTVEVFGTCRACS